MDYRFRARDYPAAWNPIETMNGQMSLDSFVQEIEERKRRELKRLDAALSEKVSNISSQKQSSTNRIKDQYESEAKIKSEREAARIVEEARLQAKKVLFDAINSNLELALDATKQSLVSYTQKPQYRKALLNMVEYARKKLGDNITIHCREEDKEVFKESQSVSRYVVGSPIKTIGGIVAEDKNGSKEIDMTFEELLRTHEDEVKSLLLERMMG